jgi:eukaryotic-like serine/threonine-protein kinase
MLAAHLYEAPQPLSERGVTVSAGLEGVLIRCLAKDRNERFAGVSLLRDALLKCDEAGRWTERDAREWWEQLATKA